MPSVRKHSTEIHKHKMMLYGVLLLIDYLDIVSLSNQRLQRSGVCLYLNMHVFVKLLSSSFMQERDKFYMSRIVVLELLQALKFKSSIPDMNLLLLVQVVYLCLTIREGGEKHMWMHD